MTLAAFAARHRSAILFVTVVLCAMGLACASGFPVAILPEVTFPRLGVIAEGGDRPAVMMEVAVTRPLEQAVTLVPGVRRIRAKTQRGAAELSVDFAWGTDILLAQQQVNSRVNDIRAQLPADVTVTSERMNATLFPILGLSLRSAALAPDALWTFATYTLKPLLAQVPGVARVVVQGGAVPEIAVEVLPDRLRAHHLSILDVEQALGAANVVRSVGRVEQHFQQDQVLVSGEFTDPAQVERVVVTGRNGIPITVGQLAQVAPAVQDRTTVVTANGAPAVLTNIVRQPDASTLDVVAGVTRVLADVRPTLPRGASLDVFYDQSVLIREAVANVRDAVLVGAFLAVMVLLLFLRDWRVTALTASIIPLTVLITLLGMRALGETINLMTLGALAVGIGLIVDDAIVIVENVFRHRAQGEPCGTAVLSAASEIAAPMISSTVTTVVVFLPLAFLSGVTGAFFSALAVTLTVALLVSLALALLVSPTLCLAFLPDRAHGGHGAAYQRLLDLYERILRGTLRRRWLVPLAAAVVLALTVLLASRLETGFMPSMDEGAFVLDFWTPPGTALSESDRLLRQIERILHENPAVRATSRRTGTEMGFFITEPNRGDMTITLKDGARPPLDTVIDSLRDRITHEVPGVQVEFVQVLQDLIGDLAGNPDPIEVKIFGEGLGPLRSAARRVAADLKAVPGLVDIKSGVVESGPALVVQVDPTRAGRLGLTPDAIAAQTQAALFGDVVTQVLQGDRRVGVRVRYPAPWRADPRAVRALQIRAPGGFERALATLADVREEPGTVELFRENQRRMFAVTGRLSQRDLGSVLSEVRTRMQRVTLPAGLTWELGGQYQSQREAFTNLLTVLACAVVLVYAVMLFQFGHFEAPTIITLLLPLALFGVVGGLWITRTPLNVSSFMGAVMLVGVVVKNGILLLDQAQHSEAEGMSAEEAVVRAGRLRLRPILMTSMTALLGLMPLALGLGAGAQMQQPLAVAVIGGLTFSTICTLIFGPLLYVMVRRRPQSGSGAA